MHRAQGQRLAGRWQATIHYDSLAIEFPMVWSGAGNTLSLSLLNGQTHITSTSLARRGDSVLVEFAQLGSALRGELKGGVLHAEFTTGTRRNPSIEARPSIVRASGGKGAPDISGTWYLPTKSVKGEDAWRLVVNQHGNDVSATILRIDGDAGALVGTWRDSVFTLYHFDGTRPARLTLRLNPDGTLAAALTTAPRGSTTNFSALRPEISRERGLPEPCDFATYTSVRDPHETFAFTGKDLSGTTVTNTDARFRNRVVLVSLGGSWCPNCHDEAPFLAELYRKYHDRGLEIVSLDFEERDQLADLTRLRAFVNQYQLKYPVLVMGQPSEVHDKLPQAVNLNTWPATFFLGRDGLVRAVRSGYAAPASGQFHTELEKDYTAIIEGLLKEN